jgi:transposase
MDERETIIQLIEQNEQLRHEVELLKRRIEELDARLAKYENPHTPPSLRRGGKGKRGQNLQVNKNRPTYRHVVESIDQKISCDRAHLNLSIDLQPMIIEGTPLTREFKWEIMLSS